MPAPALRRLMAAAELCRERDLARLKRIDDEVAALRAEVGALRAGQSVDRLAMRGAAAPLVASWEDLRDMRLAALGRRLAELAALREEARADVARSAGRVAAVRKLAKGGGARGQAS